MLIKVILMKRLKTNSDSRKSYYDISDFIKFLPK